VTAIDWAVVVAGAVAIAWVNWYFLWHPNRPR